MELIDEQIQWYEQNSNSLYDDIVSIELEKINSLYDRYEDHTDEMFVEEMIESFCKIIERQRDKINDLETEAGVYGFASPSQNSSNGVTVTNGFGSQPYVHSFIAATQEITDNCQEDFQNDKQLQAAFTQYCLSKGKSSYTVNDYCSRIKNLWKSFYSEFKDGILPEELEVNEERITHNNPLLNLYNHADEMHCYISMKINENEGNRNWANTRAAFNKFDEFRMLLMKNHR